jgi:hypothetical protein
LAIRDALFLAANSSRAEFESQSQAEELCLNGFSQFIWEVQLNGLLDGRNIAHKNLT